MRKKFMFLAVLGCLVLASCSKFEPKILKSKSEKVSNETESKDEKESNGTKSKNGNVSKEIKADGLFSIADGKVTVNIDTTLAKKKIDGLKQAFIDKKYKISEGYSDEFSYGSMGATLQYNLVVSDKRDTPLIGIEIEVDCLSGKIYEIKALSKEDKTNVIKVLKDVDMYKAVGYPVTDIDFKGREGGYRFTPTEDFLTVDALEYDKQEVKLENIKDFYTGLKDLPVLKSNEEFKNFAKKFSNESAFEIFEEAGGMVVLTTFKQDQATFDNLVYDYYRYSPYGALDVSVGDDGLKFSDETYKDAENKEARKKEVLEFVLGSGVEFEKNEDIEVINGKYQLKIKDDEVFQIKALD